MPDIDIPAEAREIANNWYGTDGAAQDELAHDIADLATRVRAERDKADEAIDIPAAVRDAVGFAFDQINVEFAEPENRERELFFRVYLESGIIGLLARVRAEDAEIARTYQRDASYDDSIVGAQQHNANQANIADAILRGTK